MYRICVSLLLLTVSSFVYAGDLDPTTQSEIDHLFKFISTSACDFKRNGTWYKASEASEHIHTKYAYLVKRNLVSSTEQFIERAATKSSITGLKYMVRCNGVTEVSSADWLKTELAAYRLGKEH